MRSMSLLKSAATAAAMLGMGAIAQAATITIDSDDFASLAGQVSGTVNGATVTAAGGVITTKCASGTCGAGVSGGPSGAEIDVNSESLTVEFAAASIAQIDIGLLYVGPAWNDPQYWLSESVYGGEVAQIVAYTADGGSITGTLTAAFNTLTGESFGIWSLGTGSAVYCDGQAAVNTTSSGGCFNLLNPFGDADVTRVVFTAVQLRGTELSMLTGGSNDTDYVVSLIRTVVPEPAVLGLLGLGLIGAAAVRRRRRAL